ncbi:flavin-containing monooxygenase FMO GS-OX-like 4 [Nephila pilipes]|uniref:Flavin-containing monooxygenase n=1 Tax=Nephila pilipes TaxID=299642 RepID=A0A8X6MSZ4_NEPPI|nr:flavin-containing monooxygenase FMO GS-OX-like 4 [Nephila pilipes]
MAPSKSRIKVAVIGAGAAGLCAGRHLIVEPDRFEFDIYEQQDDVGGTWRFSTHTGQDQYGIPVHSSMYKNLRTNLPKEVMAFPDFSFQNCDGRSFLHHTEVLFYLEEYAKHYGLYEHIKFHKLIESIRPLKQENMTEWAISFSDVITKEKETYIYDAVMVCNGHYSVPYFPEILGLNNFKGVMIHSHDYREPQDFKDLKVVVLGAGASGIDIAIEVSYVAKEVILSHNTPPKTCPLPDNTRQEKGIESIDESAVTFIGGKKYKCDALIICTGYLYHYPFFEPSCNVEIGDQKVSPLYLHMFLIDYPTLAIWAVPKLIVPFPIYDQQSKVFLKFLKGLIELPSPEVMRAETEKDFNRRLEAGFKPRHAHLMPGDWQWEYDDALCKLGKIDPVPPVVRNLFRHVHHLRTLDVIRYKDTKYNLVDNKTFEQVN